MLYHKIVIKKEFKEFMATVKKGKVHMSIAEICKFDSCVISAAFYFGNRITQAEKNKRRLDLQIILSFF